MSMRKTIRRRAVATGRLAALLMVIAVAGCDNVEWGGVDVAVMPPPPKVGPVGGNVEAGDRLPQGAVLYHVVRDSVAGTVMVPVAELVDEEMRPLDPGDDPADFGDRYITTFLRQSAEFTLFRHGRRAGTLVVDSAWVPTGRTCRSLPRATGSVELMSNSSDATEFLAMPRTQAPEGRMLPGDGLEVERRMQVVGNILAERALRARSAPLPNWSRARRQLQPFPVAEARDLGFTATFLVDDELQVGNDDEGYSLYIVYTPRAQTGYDTAYVDYVSYTASGKAAPRTIDFLDWDRDGTAEILVEVFGTTESWYAAIGQDDDEWRRLMEARCAERPDAPAPAPTDSGAVADSSVTDAGSSPPPSGPPDAP